MQIDVISIVGYTGISLGTTTTTMGASIMDSLHIDYRQRPPHSQVSEKLLLLMTPDNERTRRRSRTL